MAWDNHLADPNSQMFKDMAGEVEVGLDELLITTPLREEADFYIRVTSFNAGSVIPNFRLSWMPRNDNPTYKVSSDALMRQFQREVSFEDYRMAGIYSVQKNSLQLTSKLNFVSRLGKKY